MKSVGPGQVLGELAPRGRFHFALALRYQVRQAREPVDREFEGRYRRVLKLPGGPALIEARADDSARTGRLEVRSLSRRLGAVEAEAALRQVRHIYSLDFPLAAFEKMAKDNPPLNEVVQQLCGLRVAGIPNPYEALICSVLGQQISLVVAYKLKRNLVEAAGVPIKRDGQIYYEFPRAETLAGFTEPALQALGLSRPKARYVSHLSRRVADGELELESLREMAPEPRRERLIQETGIGPWTASYMALRSYQEHDALPLADVGLEVAATAAYRAPERLRGAALARVAEGWRPYRGWATFYLWCTRLLSPGPASPS